MLHSYSNLPDGQTDMKSSLLTSRRKVMLLTKYIALKLRSRFCVSGLGSLPEPSAELYAQCSEFVSDNEDLLRIRFGGVPIGVPSPPKLAA